MFILDFSYKRDVLMGMYHSAKFLTVIDHHKTAKEDLEGLDFARFDMEKSGCGMAWEYFHTHTRMPELLFHIQDRDLWKFESPLTRPFCTALRDSVPMEFGAWDLIANDDYLQGRVFRLIELGQTLCAIFDKEVADLAKYAFEITIKGFSGKAVNAPAKYASELGNLLAQESPFGMTYYYDGASARINCSLRSVGDFDVSHIAKLMGGGGHKNAAGFSFAAPAKNHSLGWKHPGY